MNAEKTINYFIHIVSALRGACGMAHRRVQRLYALRLRDYYRNGRNSIDGVEYVVNDRCGIDGCIDIFMESYEEAIQFGRRYKEVYIKR